MSPRTFNVMNSLNEITDIIIKLNKNKLHIQNYKSQSFIFVKKRVAKSNLAIIPVTLLSAYNNKINQSTN